MTSQNQIFHNSNQNNRLSASQNNSPEHSYGTGQFNFQNDNNNFPNGNNNGMNIFKNNFSI